MNRRICPTPCISSPTWSSTRGTENADVTVFERARRSFAAKGYALPQVVFWNVASRNLHQPVTVNEQGAGAGLGLHAQAVPDGDQRRALPYAYMWETLSAPRYRELTA